MPQIAATSGAAPRAASPPTIPASVSPDPDVASFEEMVAKAMRMALRHGIAKGGDRIVVIAGVPFGTPGSTNVVHVVRLIGDELERHKGTSGGARA